MDRDPRSGTDLKRLRASLIARMSSTVRSSFKVTLFQASITEMMSQLLIQMVSLLQPKLRAQAKLRLAPRPNGGPTETVKDQRNGMVLRKLPASAIAKMSSTAK